ncbi:hypothetical protein C8F01DRAFT_974917 [Mycena amicta]|nr:hypothetical protein C8F01DRAFT_974917 [Mycena amicta]
MVVSPALAVLQTPDVAQAILEAIRESPNGRRGLSRLARTCRAWLDPALDVLWRELDSLAPLIGLFPPHLLKKTKRPGLGLVRTPVERDWNRVIKYGVRVLRVTYDEISNNVSATVFPIFEELRPRTYLLPNLQQLTWKITSPENLDRAALFLSPELQSLVLDLGLGGTKFPTLPAFLADLGSRMKLKSLSITSPTAMPDAFPDMLLPQDSLERLTLVAPGVLSANVGRWVAYLPRLKSLQLDLSSKSVNGFFKDVRSGGATPDSIESHTDSGVFSADEMDFTDVRKSLRKLTRDGEGRSSSVFPALMQLHLTGKVATIGAFLRHISSPLTQLEMVIEDPPDAAEWRQFSTLLSDQFGDSLASLRIAATLSSRFGELVRSTSRAAPAPRRLSLEHFSSLPLLRYLSIDLPESTLFTNRDVAHLADVAPQLEEVRLCPLARFAPPATPPQLTLEDLAPLIQNCRRLVVLAVVINAKGASADLSASSNSLLWLHLGHSWVAESLQVAILLSQFSPHVEVKWFTERNRPGFVETNSRGWAKVNEILPHLQKLRLMERKAAAQLAPPPPPLTIPPPPPPVEKEVVIEYVEVVAPRPPTAEKGIDATVGTAECGVEARPSISETWVQAVPSLSDCEVQASPELVSIAVDATPEVKDSAVDATTKPVRSSAGVQTTVKAPEEATPSPTRSRGGSTGQPVSLTSIMSLVGMLRAMVLYPLGLPLRILSSAVDMIKRKPRGDGGGDVGLDTLNVRS